jgi:hypothetical protein
MERVLIECSCTGLDHSFILSLVQAKGCKYLYLEPHLTKKPLLQRIWHALKYIFNMSCRYGDFDETVIDEIQARKMREVLNLYLNDKEISAD